MDHLKQVLRTLQVEKFYANPKKCAFCTDMVIFLGFVASYEGVSADPEKVKGVATIKAFTKIKRIMTEAHAMRFPVFLKAFEVTCDASGLAIGGVLSQENHPVAYFSEKLNDA